jgi:hypothetical protein
VFLLYPSNDVVDLPKCERNCLYVYSATVLRIVCLNFSYILERALILVFPELWILDEVLELHNALGKLIWTRTHTCNGKICTFLTFPS